MQTIVGVILAGGLSSRMGRDKAGLILGGRTMLAHAVRRLRPQVAALAVNANDPVVPPGGAELPVFADIGVRAGPLGGVLAALDHTRRNHPAVSHVATVPVDSPFFPEDLVARLGQHLDRPEAIAVARSAAGLHPVFALWPVALADDLAAWLSGGGPLRMRAYLECHGAREIFFPPCETACGAVDPFFNVNTPADLDAAETWLGALEA